MRPTVSPVVVPRIDWWRVVTDLQALEHIRGQIHHAVGRSPSWVQALKNLDCEPRHQDGQALLQFWAAVTSRSIDEAPRVR